MARVLKLDRAQYGDDGLLSLYRGDDWSVRGSVVDRVNGYETPVDISELGVTGYFPSASGGPDLPVMAATGSCSQLVVTLPADQTPNVQLTSAGVGIYVVTQDMSGKLETIRTLDQAVVVLDRGFPVG